METERLTAFNGVHRYLPFTLDNNCWFLEASLASLIEIIDRVFDRLWLHLIWNIYLKHWHTRTH
jgi:hypothetical protein